MTTLLGGFLVVVTPAVLFPGLALYDSYEACSAVTGKRSERPLLLASVALIAGSVVTFVAGWALLAAA